MHIHNFHKISDMLACSGQPTEEQIKELSTQHYQVVINLGLSDAKYSLPDEAALVKQLGMNYYHIPVLFDDPQINELDTFIKYMDEHKGKKTLVHCAANYRASCFTALYLYYLRQISNEEMMDIINEIWRPDHIWESFLEEGIAHINNTTN